MKKLLLPLVIVLLLASLLITGCGDDETTTTTTTTSSTVSTSATTTATTSSGPATTQTTQTTSTDAAKYGGTITLLNALSPASNVGIPWETNSQNTWYTNYITAEPLVAYTKDGNIEPWLATSWELAEDSMSVTFQLREGVKFQDGSDFNAEAAAWQINKVIEVESSNAVDWESAEVIDEYTIRINFKKWTAAFWNDIGNDVSCCFISKAQYEEKGEDYAREHPIGTGPFIMTKFEKDVGASFERNDNYWQEGKPYLDGIECLVVQDVVTQMMSMQSGMGHYMSLQEGKVLDEMGSKGFDIIQFPAGTSVLVPDSANPDSVFADLKVREAIDWALDNESIAEAVGYGYMFASEQMPPFGHPHRVENIPAANYDIAKAKELLTEAGYPDGFKTKIITWAYDLDYALVVQQQLALVGIDAEIENLDNLKFLDYWMNGWEDSMLAVSMSFGPNFAVSYKQQCPPYGIFNPSVVVPDGLQEILDSALAATTEEESTMYNQQLTQIIYDNKMFIVYMSGGLGSVVSPVVQDADWLFGADKYHSWRPADTWLDE